MKKLLLLLILLFSIFIFSSKQDFIYDYLVFERDIPKQEAYLIAETIYKDSDSLGIEPLIVLSIMETETNVRNIFGDSGSAVGYFQLHRDATHYVANFYPYIKYKLQLINDHDSLIKYPVLQTKIAIRYLFLMEINNKDIIYALGRYNGQEKYVNRYATKVLNNYVIFSEKYLTYYNK